MIWEIILWVIAITVLLMCVGCIVIGLLIIFKKDDTTIECHNCKNIIILDNKKNIEYMYEGKVYKVVECPICGFYNNIQ